MTPLVARAQLNLVRRLVADFERRRSSMQDLSQVQSTHIAITALLRSIGHVFAKVDCADAEKARWARERWPEWSRDPIFRDFIEPGRNALLKEFGGLLGEDSEALGNVAVVADPGVPGGVRQVIDFRAEAATDLRGEPIVPQMHSAIAFWERNLREAETSKVFRT